jgi:hypothetical protein
MQSRTPLSLLLIILMLVIGAGFVLAVDGGGHSSGRAQEYQQLVGGLGFGPALDLSTCANSFDPRVSNQRPAPLGPFPDGSAFCPQNGFAIFFYGDPNGHANQPDVTVTAGALHPRAGLVAPAR